MPFANRRLANLAASPRRVSACRGSLRRGSLRRGAAALCALAVAGAVLLAMSPAQAAAQDVRAQLALSGLADKNDPAGGSRIGIHPGDSVTFSAAGVPTAGLARLGLSNLIPTVDNLLGGAARFQVRANFAGLPGGHNGTVLRGKRTAHFSFAHKGVYNFTWTVEKVTVLSTLLGKQKKTSTINLNGNELRKAGIKLNAKNQYVGQVVVRRHPPSGGISVQLPRVHVSPSAPGVGGLPSVGAPGVRLPTVHVPKPSAPGLPGLPTGGSHKGSRSGGHRGSHPPKNFSGPPISVPQEVVPKGNNAAVIPGSDNVGALPVYHGSNAFRPSSNGTGTAGGSNGSGNVRKQPRSADVAKRRTLGLANKPGAPSGQLPVLLAIIAIITLALIAGTYARLFLIRRNL